MPLYLDLHPGMELSQTAIRELIRAARGGAHDALGVRVVDLYCGEEGNVYCVIDAPSEETVRAYHVALGVPCGPVRPLDLAQPGLSVEEEAVVRRVLGEGEDPRLSPEWLRLPRRGDC